MPSMATRRLVRPTRRPLVRKLVGVFGGGGPGLSEIIVYNDNNVIVYNTGEAIIYTG